jgi:hypothetical protein
MICREVKASMPDLLLAPKQASAEIRAHVESCAECGKELRELEETMALMDTWEAPEVSPYFDTRMAVMLREEQQTAPAGWLERMRARLLFGNRVNMRPVMAAAMALVVAAGVGTYAGFGGFSPAKPPAQVQSPVIKDLQSMDDNAQMFQQLSTLDQQDADSGSL